MIQCLRIYIFVVFFWTLTSALASWKRNSVSVQDGGYNGLLIAISKEEKEDAALIRNIKEIFTEGSSFLFEATNHRVYWKTITILVPNSWTNLAEYKPAKTETFDRANIRIDYGTSKGPYTHVIEGCGKQGQYINLTPQYVRNKKYAESGWGPRDKTVVHEWAHLRWGVFDEYSTTTPFFVMEGNKIEETRCSQSVAGVYEDDTSKDKKCTLDPETGVYTKSCKFIPDVKQTANVSIMYKQYLPSISFFCREDKIDPNNRHFEEAPNRQNTMCETKSVWEVMLETDDFIGGKNPPLKEGSVDTTPKFRIVQSTTRRVVLVLDTSESMMGVPLKKLRQGTMRYLSSTIDTGSYVGIVEFSTFGTELAPLTLVSDDSSRDKLIAALPSSVSGRTSIGSGVLKGIEVLSSGQSPNGGYLLVISDGKNNEWPDINVVLDDVINSGITVDTIAFTDNADNALSDLSSVSGGSAYFYSSASESITGLIDSLAATISDRSDVTNESLAILLYSEALPINDTDGTTTGYVVIDTSVGVDTVFFFTWLLYPVEVVLENPKGRRFDNTNEEYDFNRVDSIIIIRISERAMAGRWKFSISNHSPSPSHIVTVTVESKKASTDDTPITLTSFVSDPFIDYQVTRYITIFAFLSKGNESVANADVFAILETPNANGDVIQLYDNGANADITKYDGVYSAYFFNFTDNGRYSVEVKVRANEHTSLIRVVENSRSFSIQREEEIIQKPVDMFERSASGGAVQVANYIGVTKDRMRPSRIVDLSVTKVSYQNQSVTLQWTAVGDDLDKGTVYEYDLRFSSTFQDLLRNFTNSTKVTSEDVINGNLLTIKQPGQLEEFSVRLPKRGENVSYFFALMAIDEANNTGGVSNIVSANLAYIPPFNIDPEQPRNILVWTLLAVSGVGVVVFVLLYVYGIRSRHGFNPIFLFEEKTCCC